VTIPLMRELLRLDPRLLLMAAAAGVVDAISLTTLGVFTAAVTANLVFVGLALGDADVHTALRAALAIVGFASGAFAASRLMASETGSPGAVVLAAVGALQAAFLIVWLAADGDPEGATLDLLAVVSSIAMGGQTAATRVWHTGIVTTYLSGTLVGMLGALAAPGKTDPEWPNQAGVIGAVAIGATVAAVTLTHAHDSVPTIPVALTALVAFAVMRSAGRSRPAS
jgi:uncharacterized membrane protein YoaK (UPF0700 family)